MTNELRRAAMPGGNIVRFQVREEGANQNGSLRMSLDLEMYWPVLQAHEEDLYFYQKEIEAELPDFHMKIPGHGEMIMLGSYSYLGLNGHPKINAAAQAAIERYGTGTHGVRLL